jgi:segregation and condensation protein B
MTLDAKLEAILFFKAEPISIKKLAQFSGATEDDIRAALRELNEKLGGRGVTLIEKDDEVMLGTASDASGIIEALTKEELNRDLGKAGLETLSIILYRGPITRSGIDYIRGVNSTFILRNLMVRGLVEKVPNPEDQRSFLYRPTFELLAHLGISRVEDLPEYQNTNESIDVFIKKPEEESRDEQKHE